jgi:hypothetical protein
MQDFQLSTDEIDATRRAFPSLHCVDGRLWNGTLHIDNTFREYRIVDDFHISIAIGAEYPKRLPRVEECGGRTLAILKKHSLTDQRSVHSTPQNGACLCVRQEEQKRFPPGTTFVEFVEKLVVPYFYGLSYFDERGSWPWSEYGHGGIGILEYYAGDSTDQTPESIRALAPLFSSDEHNWKRYQKQFRSPSGARACPCGSNIPFSACHRLAFEGLLRMHDDLKRFRLNPYKLFKKTPS